MVLPIKSIATESYNGKFILNESKLRAKWMKDRRESFATGKKAIRVGPDFVD